MRTLYRAALAAACLLCGLSPADSAHASDGSRIGDANFDGVVTAADAAVILRADEGVYGSL